MKNLYLTIGLFSAYFTYGKHEFIITLNKNKFKNLHKSFIMVKDCMNNDMEFEFKNWGRRLKCSFTIKPETPDGIATIDLNLDCNNKIYKERLSFWVVKNGE